VLPVSADHWRRLLKKRDPFVRAFPQADREKRRLPLGTENWQLATKGKPPAVAQTPHMEEHLVPFKPI
jgi:hypothetical protein